MARVSLLGAEVGQVGPAECPGRGRSSEAQLVGAGGRGPGGQQEADQAGVGHLQGGVQRRARVPPALHQHRGGLNLSQTLITGVSVRVQPTWPALTATTSGVSPLWSRV